ncbi:hypothetical protein H072_937 [Dactylellina haptotyla CBS 200.50]|uniref:Uncharacterized protein n=1 Tax=Dactylellina haptotyla (strain CBS 200.50) TaxID=1284197 RepID=S8AQ47_DACHA|nr:hypothetical protein H072_937 [Dactylellina haptotyla CBS 200.50]
MRTTPILRMRPAQMLRMRQTPTLAVRQSPILRMAVPKEEQSGHTISQRLRRIKEVPVELVPLAVVLGAALVAAGYAMVHKLTSDKTLRLSRQASKH